jgi:hypothetical protein
MTIDVERLLELARVTPVSAAEREAQRLSFAYGNAKLSDARVTRETIERASVALAENPVTIPSIKT